MRTQFTSVIRSRSFQMRAWIWAGVAAVFALSVFVFALMWLSGHHLVRSEKGLVVVQKRFVGLSETCVDIRRWTWNDAVAHPYVSKALIQAGYADLLPRPPPDPTTMEKAASKMRQWRDEAVTAGSNAWQRFKERGQPAADGGQ